jgi:hypothetical protein
MRAWRTVLVAWYLVVAGLSVASAATPPPQQQRQPRPIPLGVSGGNVNDRSLIACCSGTLGALLTTGGQFYILSNNHVLARSNRGTLGDPITQPGAVDVSCQVIPADAVANLSAFIPISFTATNPVDAAIAQIIAGQVATDGTILQVGPPSSTPIEPSLGLKVQKMGRTTGLTTGQVSALNVTVTVAYPRVCGVKLLAQKAQFVGQFAVTPGTFSAAGDSGALIVEQVSSAPRPVGLLFAGSPGMAVANLISAVLAAFSATIVGGTAAAEAAAGAAGETAVSEQELSGAMAIQERHQEALMALPGVVGVGIGLDAATGQLRLEVYLDRANPELEHALPESLEGLPVRAVVTGPVVAQSSRRPSRRP